MSKRVLVLGNSGMLGMALCHRLKKMGLNVLTLARTEFDAQNPNFDVVRAAAADAVINALGMINRRLDQPEADFLKVNGIFPRRLADICERSNIPLIHISTDCVFDGMHGPYDEHSTPSAKDLYGRSKFWGEPANALVLRTSIIGPELNNHYSLLSWFLSQHGRVPGYRNHYWNGVTTDELSRAIGAILLEDRWCAGVHHVFGEDLTKYELLCLVQKVFETDGEVVPTMAPSSRDTRLRTVYPNFLAALNVASMRDQLERLRGLCDERGAWMAAS